VIAGNVDAAFGFWSQDAVEVQLRQPVNVLRLYDYGVPPYPELVVFVREDFLQREPDTVRKFLRATARGYRDAIDKPEVALVSMASRVEGDTVEGLRPYFDAVRPVLQADAPVFGYLNLPVLKAYLGWAKETGVIDYNADPSEFATNAYLPEAGKP
jgi:ABC-type nitrate/sulfonate/bicarbonate transport system substrate-binding protein